jgi:hypothetical protein
MPRRPKQEPIVERRGHPALRYNQKIADQFGVMPAVDAAEPPRELVRVDHIPTPPDVEAPQAPPRGQRKAPVVDENPEDRVAIILREELSELAERLHRFGVRFDAPMQQSMFDYGMAVLAGAVGGGAIGSRQ